MRFDVYIATDPTCCQLATFIKIQIADRQKKCEDKANHHRRSTQWSNTIPYHIEQAMCWLELRLYSQHNPASAHANFTAEHCWFREIQNCVKSGQLCRTLERIRSRQHRAWRSLQKNTTKKSEFSIGEIVEIENTANLECTYKDHKRTKYIWQPSPTAQPCTITIEQWRNPGSWNYDTVAKKHK